MNNMNEVTQWIESFTGFPRNPSLHRVKALLNAVSSPQDKLKFVHVAGTNGKGSTAKMIATALRVANYKTGLFISPHLYRVNERISINESLISDEDFIEIANKIKNSVHDFEEIKPTFFDILTTIALEYFARQNCDIVVLEVGLGGKFDATNIIAKSEVSVITSISLDHTHILGDDIIQIANEKCGIIKTNSLTVCYPLNNSEVQSVIDSVSAKNSATLIKPNLSDLTIKSEDILSSKFSYKMIDYTLTLIGRHQIYNAIMAIEAVEVLNKSEFKISLENLQTALKTASFNGRMECLQQNPPTFIDGAHNEDGVLSLVNTLKTHFNNYKKIIVCGMVADKNYNDCVDVLSRNTDIFIATKPTTYRALSEEIVADIAEKNCNDVLIAENIEEAINLAKEKAKNIPNSCIIFCGSLYTVSDVRNSFK